MIVDLLRDRPFATVKDLLASTTVRFVQLTSAGWGRSDDPHDRGTRQRASGSAFNGKISPLVSELNSGDEVDILARALVKAQEIFA